MMRAAKPVVLPVTVPQIISVGLPPEQHADRVTSEMIEFIVRLRAAVWAKGEATLPPSAMGNPTSQARHVANLRKLNGALWPFLHLTPGKRGRFTLETHRNHRLGRQCASPDRCFRRYRRVAVQAVAIRGAYSDRRSA